MTTRVEDGEFALLAVATDHIGAGALARWRQRQLSAAHVGASVAVATHRFGEDLSKTWQRARADNHVEQLQDGHAEPTWSADAGATAIRGSSDGSSEPLLGSRPGGLAARGREGGEVSTLAFADVPQPESEVLTDQLTPETSHASAAEGFAHARVLASAAASVLADHDRIAADLHQHVIDELSVTGIGLRGMVHASCGARPDSTVTVAAPHAAHGTGPAVPKQDARWPARRAAHLARTQQLLRPPGHDLTITGEDSAHAG